MYSTYHGSHIISTELKECFANGFTHVTTTPNEIQNVQLPATFLTFQCVLPLHGDSWRMKSKPQVLVIIGSMCCPPQGDTNDTSS